MKQFTIILSCVAFLLSVFAVHVSLRTRDEMQAFAHSLPRIPHDTVR